MASSFSFPSIVLFPDYSLRLGQPSDALFLGRGVLEAERDTHGRGIWDCYCGFGSRADDQPPVTEESSALVTDALAYVVANSTPSCLYHYTHFIVVEHIPSKQPVACAAFFLYPDSDILDTLNFISVHMQQTHGWSKQQTDAAAARLDFLSSSYPSDVDFDGRWMIEGVYVHPDHRRLGLASKVTAAAVSVGRGAATECLISCAVKNVTARTCYEKLGFVQKGEEPHSDECFLAIGCTGFIYLSKLFALNP